MRVERITLYSDGSCHGNPGPGGYAAIILKPDGKTINVSGSDWYTTNNRMELTAVIEGLKLLSSPSIVTIITDSKYVVDPINRGSIRALISNPKKANRDLWEKVLSLSKKHTLSAKWVKGHVGNKLNEKCDVLANDEVRKLEREKDIRQHTIAELLLNPAESLENIARRYPGGCPVKTVQKYYEQFMEKRGGF